MYIFLGAEVVESEFGTFCALHSAKWQAAVSSKLSVAFDILSDTMYLCEIKSHEQLKLCSGELEMKHFMTESCVSFDN